MKTWPARHSWPVDHRRPSYSRRLLVGEFRALLLFVLGLDWRCLGIFVAKGDVGVGTIVGSAVFNIVCVIGICGLFVNEVGFGMGTAIN